MKLSGSAMVLPVDQGLGERTVCLELEDQKLSGWDPIILVLHHYLTINRLSFLGLSII